MEKLDITGHKFGRLLAVKRTKTLNGKEYWLFKCNCGKEKEIRKSHVTSFAILSCGCFNKEKITKHGFADKKDGIYRMWERIKYRTQNKNFKQYKDYGGRGITVCDEWLKSFISFRNWCLQNGYKKGLSIDRINNDGNYCPENCKFSSRKEQQRNRRNNVIIKYKDESKCLADWAEEKGLKFSTLWCRLFVYGWDIERALNEANNRTKVATKNIN